ncbi:MAG TPA: ABC transporter ATP-binding protein [Stellaceae bacterium]|nr:ABC transporter ATP-binding protein [Stellaceae bacterium]
MNEAAILVSDLSLRLGSFELRNFGLSLERGQILVLLGPNGAGKSVSLEAIAGFHRLRGGHILIHGRDVTRLPPERRHVSLLFQNFGLFPHLTVAQNVAFGRRNLDPSRLLARFGIAHLAAERPDILSPGQKQRVALARALAAQPDLFLFDEPFSALDAPTRDLLRGELKSFLRESGVPAIFVTHDRTDAEALADTIAVMDQGRIVQAGEAAEILRRPADATVASLLGVENILPGRTLGRSGGVMHVAIGDAVVAARPATAAGAVSVCIRAEDVVTARPDRESAAGAAANRLAARVGIITPLGPFYKVMLDCGFPLVAYLTKREVRDLGIAPGSRVVAEIEAEAIHVFSAGTARSAAEGGG